MKSSIVLGCERDISRGELIWKSPREWNEPVVEVDPVQILLYLTEILLFCMQILYVTYTPHCFSD